MDSAQQSRCDEHVGTASIEHPSPQGGTLNLQKIQMPHPVGGWFRCMVLLLRSPLATTCWHGWSLKAPGDGLAGCLLF